MQFSVRTLVFSILPLLSHATVNPSLNEALNMATTQLDRLALLSTDDAWHFDFAAQSSYTFSPGSVVNANAASWPAAVGNELTMAMISLGPCSMLPPHLHPRASNYVVAIAGNTTTYMFEENGARLVTSVLTPGKMTIFPRGSLHAMQNTGCTNAQLVSALSNSDQGTTNILNGLYQLPDNIVAAAFGNQKNLKVNKAKIAPIGFGAIVGDSACLAKCGLPSADS